MAVITCVDDLRKQMRRRVPRMFYDYCESGSWTESTFAANETDLQDIKFRQRVAIDVSARSQALAQGGAFLLDARLNLAFSFFEVFQLLLICLAPRHVVLRVVRVTMNKV